MLLLQHTIYSSLNPSKIHQNANHSIFLYNPTQFPKPI